MRAIRLASDEFVDALELTVLLARAQHPEPQELKGADCFSTRLQDTVLGPDTPFVLNQEDKRTLERLFKDLPPISLSSTDAERAAFLEAFRKHPDKPSWTPALHSERHLLQRRHRYQRSKDRHWEELKKRVASKEITAVDFDGTPTTTMAFGTRLVVAGTTGAAKYIGDCGFQTQIAVREEAEIVISPAHRRERADALSPMIKRAMDESADKYDTKAVWDIMVKMAGKNEAPLLGIDHDNQIRWQPRTGKPRALDYDALSARVRRARNADQRLTRNSESTDA